MTTTQNVTELQPRLTREQLIDAARTAAKFLPVASAQLMTELANRLDYTSVALCEAMKQRKELAAENATLRDDVMNWAKSAIALLSGTPKPAAICTCLKPSASLANSRLSP
ncbi:hypothetical protein [Leclercia pneumoniae]|uniref:hypothetical protein n=1 Tax=Leclercia pneumoniae TaxID=2815358 RepID=UPI0030D52858